MTKKLPVGERTFLIIMFVNAFVFALFFSFVLSGGNVYSILEKEEESSVISYQFPENPDNVYLWSEINLDDGVSAVVYHSDGNVTIYDKLPTSGIGDNTSGFTSNLITSQTGISEIRISGTSTLLKTGTVSSGSLLASNTGLVLGVSTGMHENELLFLEKSGVEVISREQWGAGSVDEPPQLKNLGSIHVYNIANESDESDLQALNSTYEYHLSRCVNVPGIAPVSCSEDETWDDISYNYVVGFDGDVYQGRVGGNGTPGLHEGEDGDSISVALISKGGEFSETQIIQTELLVGVLSKMNGFDLGSETLIPVDTTESEDLEVMISGFYQKAEESVPPQIVQVSEEAKKLVDKREYVKVGEEVQVLVNSDVNNDAEEVLTRAGADELDQLGENVSTTLVKEDIVEQTLTEMMVADENAQVQLNYIYRIDSWDNTDPNRSIPSDYTAGTHWNLDKIKAPEVWKDMGGCTADNSCGGDTSVVVAVLDTGVAYEDYNYDAGSGYSIYHFDPFGVDIPSNSSPNGVYNEGYDRVHSAITEFSNVNFVNPYDAWQDYACNSLRTNNAEEDGLPHPCNATELEKINHANDDHGHGSFVTSIIATNTSDAAPNNLLGIAHNVSIMPVKVFLPNDTSMCLDISGHVDTSCPYEYGDYRSVAWTTTLVDGINYAVANGANIINMSLGGPGSDSVVEQAISDAVSADVMVVVASGNYDDDTQYYFPANAPGAFTVGATNDSDVRASYSNYGDELSLVAPVGDSGSQTAGIKYLCSSDNTCDDETDPNLFQSFTSVTSPTKGIGTSYAAPQVAAAAALLWSDDPTATLAEIEAALKNSAQDLGTTGFDTQYGYGLLDIEAALAREENVPDPPPEPPPPETPEDQYFTWYDTKYSDRNAWILVGNPSTTNNAYVSVRIGGKLYGSKLIAPGGRWTPEWRNVQDGPVKVSSDSPVYATQRSKIYNSFNEYAAIPENAFSTKFYFTWYDTKYSDRNSWILVGNPSTTQSAWVTVKIGGKTYGSKSIAPGGRWTPEWRNVQDGPVLVTSNIPVYATQRSKIYNSFNEYAGIPETAFSNKFFFTWYDTKYSDRNAWVLVGNPSSTQSAWVTIKIGGKTYGSRSVAPGTSWTPEWRNVQDGPVEVTSSIPIYATQRVKIYNSFNEYSGIPDSGFSTKFYFTWYDTKYTDRNAWVLVGNPSTSQWANVTIKIGGKTYGSKAIAPGGRWTPEWRGVQDGPVEVTSSIPVYATQRVKIYGTFNEYPGIISN